MGGPGSGGGYRWWVDRKATVEESLRLGMTDLRRWLYQDAAGALTWTDGRGRTYAITCVLLWGDDPMVVLSYRWNGAEDVTVRVPLEATPMRFGGRRWWFTCPLARHGRGCGRRCSKLYLPPGGKYFGCRTCHNLAYRSAQEAHQAERLFARLGFGPDVAREFAAWPGW